MSEFIAMGGYAWYVWPAYGIFLSVLMVNWWSARRLRANAVRAARRRLLARNKP